MNNKICLIHQPAGIGDVFFLQYVVRKYMAMGYHVIWPLKDEILWIKDYILDIEFCSKQDDFPGKQYYGQDVVILSPQFVYLGLDKPHFWGIPGLGGTRLMASKYTVLNLDHKKWAEGFTFKRNREKEEQLYYTVLGLKDDSEYVYVNDFTNTDIRRTGTLANKSYDYPIIENRIIDGFSLFDWTKVLENAKEIHTIPTAVCFIVDVIDTDAKIFYYPQDKRQYEDVIDIFSKVTEYRNA